MSVPPVTIDGASILRFARGMRLREDPTRDRWVVVGPERLFVPDPVALEVLRLLDGVRSVDMVTDDLAARFAAPRATIATDVLVLLQDLATRGVVTP